MNPPKLTYERMNCLDNIEWLNADAYEASFPVHFHDRICITLVKQGLERTDTLGRELLTPRGSISLTPAGEVHANPNINDGTYSFTTYYVSPEVFGHFVGAKYFSFKERVITEPLLYQQLLQFTQEKKSSSSPKRIARLMQHLIQHYVVKGYIEEEGASGTFDAQLAYDLIQEQLDEKITLDYLASKLGMSKFSFLRAFKKAAGITPGQFINIKRVERSKKFILAGYPLVETALAVGFFDQSHFHKHFRHLVGITPRCYQQACNIIQE